MFHSQPINGAGVFSRNSTPIPRDHNIGHNALCNKQSQECEPETLFKSLRQYACPPLLAHILQHLFVTNAASAFGEDSDRITRFVSKQWQPPMLLDGFLKRDLFQSAPWRNKRIQSHTSHSNVRKSKHVLMCFPGVMFFCVDWECWDEVQESDRRGDWHVPVTCADNTFNQHRYINTQLRLNWLRGENGIQKYDYLQYFGTNQKGVTMAATNNLIHSIRV